MSDYRFPSSEERHQLLQELKELEGSEGKEISQTEVYQNYIMVMTGLDSEMERLSKPLPDSTDDGMPAVNKTEKEMLLLLLQSAGRAGEAFLALAEADGEKNLRKGLAGVVNKLQGVLSRDFDVISSYDPEENLSLSEIQEKSRTKSINLKSESLQKLEKMQNPRISMTVLDSRGNPKKGVFVKANYNHFKSDFNKMMENAAQKSSPEGQEEISKIMESFNDFLINKKSSDLTGESVTQRLQDDYLIGVFHRYLEHEYPPVEQPITKNEIKTFIGKVLDLRVDTISPESIKALAKGFSKLKAESGIDICNCDLELKEGDRIDNRSTCMSAVAGLLGVSGLLAKSDNMICKDENGNIIKGTFMDYGKGFDLNDNPALFMHVSSNPYKKMNSLMKQIADLQVVDLLCLNVDRNGGNLLYQVDEKGNIIGIQGIGNDTSFGNGSITDDDIENLNVMSKSMSEKLQGISKEMFKFVLRGRGLSDKEIDKAGDRLELLKKAIKLKKIRVIDDNELGDYSFADFGSPSRKAPNTFDRINYFVMKSLKNYKKEGLNAKVTQKHSPDKQKTAEGAKKELSKEYGK